MKCPIDQTDLTMTDRQGVEIDYCPKCRGVWLDRGELDKIVERSESPVAPSQARTSYPREEQYRQRDSHGRSEGYSDYQSKNNDGRKKKKESFLGDLFDF